MKITFLGAAALAVGFAVLIFLLRPRVSPPDPKEQP
jgi:hypothetical protein